MLRRLALARAARPLRRLLGPAVARWPFPVRVRIPALGSIYVHLSSAIGRGLVATHDFDPAVRRAIEARLGADDTFVDVGANVGFYSLVARRLVGRGGEVHAFEVDPRSVVLLERTVRANGWHNLLVHATALGRHKGTVRLELRADPAHTRVRQDPSGGSSTRYPLAALDDWLDRLADGRLTCIKVDVEGYELEVLRGARRVLKELRPAVICEVGPATRAQVSAFMKAMGYCEIELTGAFDPTLVFEPDGEDEGATG